VLVLIELRLLVDFDDGEELDRLLLEGLDVLELERLDTLEVEELLVDIDDGDDEDTAAAAA